MQYTIPRKIMKSRYFYSKTKYRNQNYQIIILKKLKDQINNFNILF